MAGIQKNYLINLSPGFVINNYFYDGTETMIQDLIFPGDIAPSLSAT